MAAKKDQPTFEGAMERLDAIVEQMESDSLPLEELLLHYEEGLKLVKFCSEKLDAAEKRIEIIARDASGAAKLVEFEKVTVSAAVAVSPAVSASSSSDGAEENGVRLF